MIQYLTYCKKYPNNQRTFDNWLENIGYNGEWNVKKFAGKLKQIASLLTGIPVEKFEDQEFKKSLLGSEWSYGIQTGMSDPFPDCEFMNMMPVREFLQKLGTEAIRNGLHENAWINALWCDYKKVHIGTWGTGHELYDYPKWLISDCRFKNEAKSVKEHGGIVVRLTRNSDKKPDHPSETDLDEYKFDYVIDNQGKTIGETKEMVCEFMDKYGL